MSLVLGTFNDHMQNGVYRVDKQGTYGRKTSKAGSWTDRITQNIDAQPDVYELAHRVDNESRTTETDEVTGKSVRCKIVSPCSKFPIVQGDPCFAFLGKKDFCPYVLSHCNGIAHDEFPHPLSAMDAIYFVGLADKNYAGDMTETSMTLQQRGTFSFCPDQPIEGGTDLVAVPNCDYLSIKKGDPLYYVPDLMNWPDEDREVFFKWIPASDFKKALRHIRAQVRIHVDVFEFEKLLKSDKFLGEVREKDKKSGKDLPWVKKISNMSDNEITKIVNLLLENGATGEDGKATTIGRVIDYHRYMACELIFEHLTAEVRSVLFGEYKKARSMENSTTKWNFNERWDRMCQFGQEKMDYKNSFKPLVDGISGQFPWLKTINDLFFILERGKRYSMHLENTLKRFTKARTQRGCTREGKTQALLLQQ